MTNRAQQPESGAPQSVAPSFASAASLPESGGSTALWGLANRRLRWSLSWKGWIAVLLTGIGAFLLFLRYIHPFLAVTVPVSTNTMVVEGWMDPMDLASVAAEFKRGHYQRIFTTGGPVHGLVGYLNDYSTAAHNAAQKLIALGLPPGVVQSVPSHVSARDRTYGSAVALHDWIKDHHAAVPSFVVVTMSVHARRSLYLFRMAFDDDTKIGVISLPNADYDAAHWWRYSEGVKDIVSEVTSYLYTRLLFHPARQSAVDSGLSFTMYAQVTEQSICPR